MKLFETLGMAFNPNVGTRDINRTVTHCRNCNTYKNSEGFEVPAKYAIDNCKIINKFCDGKCFNEFKNM